MYAVGSKVVHPYHGAGTIVRIQEKSIGDSTNFYYVIDTVPSPREMRLMVPVDDAERVGLRRVGEASRLREMLSVLTKHPSEDEVETDFRARKATMTERLRSGQFAEVVKVVRELFAMSMHRSLGTTDRRFLEQGKEMLAGELALAANIDREEAMEEIEKKALEMVPQGEKG
ncbi:MAG: CarD family transcriptional regulator [Chloroflexota bacterium]|nr:CarD family transcriptional regulator [Chloroflexota bacterium]